MIKFLQERINAGTKDYEANVTDRATDEARSAATELSDKQARVRDLTRKLAQKLNQEGDGEEGR